MAAAAVRLGTKRTTLYIMRERLARRSGGFSEYPNENHALKFEVTTKLSDITLGRSTKMLLVVAAEIRGIFIAHTESGARRV